jgi:uncharacterized protein (DUF2237 family)|tara:strand:- start:1121 stop:1498 length:378 start_codon:yes stop_codon:yes gene_type:complete
MIIDESVNVFGEKLLLCGDDPITGFFRDGVCNTCKDDMGSHTICVEASQDFLEYSRSRGNDLMTPIPEYNFSGVQAGDSWCLCAARWLEAQKNNMAPRVHLTRTHIKALEIVPMELLKKYAVDLN